MNSPGPSITIGSLFAGIGGLELGLEWAGLGPTVWQVEQSEYCRQVLAKHWPDVARYDDVCTVGAGSLAAVDLICGGFPCQDVSAAGKGAGLSGDRSGLWYEFLRIVRELRPRVVVVENVASGAARWVDAVRADLAGADYDSLPVPLSAADCGAWHRRARVFIVAADAESIKGCRLSEREGEEVSEPGSDSQHAADAPSNGIQGLRDRGPGADAEHTGGDGGYWAAEPAVGRVALRVPHRVDRLRALGNCVVPQCAQVVGEVIKQLLAMEPAQR